MPHKSMPTLGDYMQTEVVTLLPTATVREAITLMLKKKTNGAVVVDTQNHLVGILSSWDIIKHIVPEYLRGDRHLAGFEASDVFVTRIHEVADDPISDFMTTCVHSAKKTDSLIKGVALLAEFHIRQLPIVDEKGHLVGYLNRTDIKRAVGDVLKQKT